MHCFLVLEGTHVAICSQRAGPKEEGNFFSPSSSWRCSSALQFAGSDVAFASVDVAAGAGAGDFAAAVGAGEGGFVTGASQLVEGAAVISGLACFLDNPSEWKCGCCCSFRVDLS